MVRQGRFIVVVISFLIGCAVLLVVGCAGVRSEAPQKEEQARSDRCEGTRTFKTSGVLITTNDVPGCPKGGLLSGTDERDELDGGDGNDEIHGLGDKDVLYGGLGGDVIYGGPGDDFMRGNTYLGDDRDRARDILHGAPGNDEMMGEEGDDVLYGGDGDDNRFSGVKGLRAFSGLSGGEGEDVLYGGDGNDLLAGSGDGDRDKLYCGEGKNLYPADKIDYVDSSCEVKKSFKGIPL
jgi:hypothetical protein